MASPPRPGGSPVLSHDTDSARGPVARDVIHTSHRLPVMGSPCHREPRYRTTDSHAPQRRLCREEMRLESFRSGLANTHHRRESVTEDDDVDVDAYRGERSAELVRRARSIDDREGSTVLERSGLQVTAWRCASGRRLVAEEDRAAGTYGGGDRLKKGVEPVVRDLAEPEEPDTTVPPPCGLPMEQVSNDVCNGRRLFAETLPVHVERFGSSVDRSHGCAPVQQLCGPEPCARRHLEDLVPERGFVEESDQSGQLGSPRVVGIAPTVVLPDASVRVVIFEGPRPVVADLLGEQIVGGHVEQSPAEAG